MQIEILGEEVPFALAVDMGQRASCVPSRQLPPGGGKADNAFGNIKKDAETDTKKETREKRQGEKQGKLRDNTFKVRVHDHV